MSIHKDKFLAVNSAFSNESTAIVVATVHCVNAMIQSKFVKQIEKAEKDFKKSRKLYGQWAEGNKYQP